MFPGTIPIGFFVGTEAPTPPPGGGGGTSDILQAQVFDLDSAQSNNLAVEVFD